MNLRWFSCLGTWNKRTMQLRRGLQFSPLYLCFLFFLVDVRRQLACGSSIGSFFVSIVTIFFFCPPTAAYRTYIFAPDTYQVSSILISSSSSPIASSQPFPSFPSSSLSGCPRSVVCAGGVACALCMHRGHSRSVP